LYKLLKIYILLQKLISGSFLICIYRL